MILDVAECDGARLARDPSYDGRFFTGVCTTGRLLRPNSLNFGLVFVVGLKPPRSPQPGRAPIRRLIGRCILSGYDEKPVAWRATKSVIETDVPRSVVRT